MERFSSPTNFQLQPGEVHAWLFDLDGDIGAVAGEQALSPQEYERARRFKFDLDRRRFITRRGILRHLLAHYLDMDPASIIYITNPYGKLSLAGNALVFNLSHSQGRAAFELGLYPSVGVDLEQVRPLPDLAALSARWFSPRELVEIATLPSDIQTEAFFYAWTQKEAYIKARGMGLSVPLEQFSVAVDPRQPGGLVEIKGWQMAACSPEPGWRAAVCAQSESAVKVTWRL